jgi:hypothetical protein
MRLFLTFVGAALGLLFVLPLLMWVGIWWFKFVLGAQFCGSMPVGHC